MISKVWKFVFFFFVKLAHGKGIAPVDYCDHLTALKANNTIYGLEGVFDSNRAPSGWETKYKSHTPISEMFDTSIVAVHVPHGVSPDHYITTIWIEDGNTGELLGCRSILNDREPQAEFAIQPDIESIICFEHCSLHGVWKGIILHRFEGLIHRNIEYGMRGIFTKDHYPVHFEGKLASHIPTISVTTNAAGTKTVSVVVSHPITESAGKHHRVTMIWVKDQKDNIVAQKWFSSIDEPKLSFERVQSMSILTAFAYCNFHGVWSTSLDLKSLDVVPMHNEL